MMNNAFDFKCDYCGKVHRDCEVHLSIDLEDGHVDICKDCLFDFVWDNSYTWGNADKLMDEITAGYKRFKGSMFKWERRAE